MTYAEIIEKIHNIGIVPVVKIDRVEDAVPLAKALIDGYIPCAEVTFRTDAAEEAIKLMTDAYPEMLVGAGTVISTEHVDKALAAGATFIVSPGLDPEIVKYCQEKNVPVLPGVATASDIHVAVNLGLDIVKFFPAEANGGLSSINALAGPFPNLKFMPTGGVNTDNMMSYLKSDKIVACGGTWMVKDELIKEGRFDEITEISKDAILKMLDLSIAHVGINPEGLALTDEISKFERIFSRDAKEGNTSYFINDSIEFMKEKGLGEKGHIAIGASDLGRAIYYLENQGFELDPTSLKEKNGKPVAIYLKDEIAGFAIHLMQK